MGSKRLIGRWGVMAYQQTGHLQMGHSASNMFSIGPNLQMGCQYISADASAIGKGMVINFHA